MKILYFRKVVDSKGIRYIDNICYIKNQHDKVVMKFDVPKISQMERENRKELNNLLDEVFG